MRTEKENLAKAAAFPLIYAGKNTQRAAIERSLDEQAAEMVIVPHARKTVARGRRVSRGRKHRGWVESQRRAEICKVRICKRLTRQLRRRLYDTDEEE